MRLPAGLLEAMDKTVRDEMRERNRAASRAKQKRRR